MRLSDRTQEQIEDAYKRLASEGRYRPAAPSDGFGNLAVPPEELDLDAEAHKYALHWWEEEDDGRYNVGSCNYPSRPATIFAIEAARTMCAGMEDVALPLLRMAVAELEALESQEPDQA